MRPPRYPGPARAPLAGPVISRTRDLGSSRERPRSNRREPQRVGCLLKTRRSRLTPADVGLPVYTGGRRVPGLRREEVITPASSAETSQAFPAASSTVSPMPFASTTTSTRISKPSQAPDTPLPQRRASAQLRVRPAIQLVLDAMPATPAFVLSARSDILATNALGRALNQPLYESQGERVNHARFLFLDRRSEALWHDWNKIADQTVASLRAEAGRNPFDRDLTDLVGELASRSDEFRTRWATHNVPSHLGDQTHPPFACRRLGRALRDHSPARRPGPEPAGLRARASLPDEGSARSPGELERHTPRAGHPKRGGRPVGVIKASSPCPAGSRSATAWVARWTCSSWPPRSGNSPSTSTRPGATRQTSFPWPGRPHGIAVRPTEGRPRWYRSSEPSAPRLLLARLIDPECEASLSLLD